MLEIKNVSKHFEGLKAIDNVSFEIEEGKITGLIGPNGAGKTTLFNCITGFYSIISGKVTLDGEDITNLSPHEVCWKGIARTYQVVRPFKEMSAFENILVAARFGTKRSKNINESRKKAEEVLEFIRLYDKKDTEAENLTLRDRRFVEIGRVLATEPKYVLLDEVMPGLNPTEAEEAMKLIRRIRNELGITVFWVEHVMRAIMGVAENIVVLDHGERIAEGPPEKISKDEKVIEAYLGEEYEPTEV